MAKAIGLAPKSPDNSEQLRLQKEQSKAADSKERALQEEQNAELKTTLRRRRGSRSLLSEYAQGFGNTLG